VLARNWRSRQGEIDVIAAGEGCLVFCEVKTRSSTVYGQPFEAVTRAKQQKLRRLAAEWLRTGSDRTGWGGTGAGRGGGRPPDIRFDVASVRGTSLEVIEGAF
jgi:putative endonuclease